MMRGAGFDLSSQSSIWGRDMILSVQCIADEMIVLLQRWHTWVIVMRVLLQER